MIRFLPFILALLALSCEIDGEKEPQITEVLPSFGSINGGETVTIRGNHFASGVGVALGGVDILDVEILSDEELTFVTPAAAEGAVDVSVTASGRFETRRTDGFTYQDPAVSPQISYFSPTMGHCDGGTAITFSGVNYMEGAQVFFQGLPAATVTVMGGNLLMAVTPALPLGLLEVRIVNTDGRQVIASEGFTSQRLSTDEASILFLVNQARDAAGVPLLTIDTDLCTAARAHCQDMIDRYFYSHINPDGLGPPERVLAQGVAFDAVGENIMAATATPQATFEAWMDSPGHRANIIDPTYTRTGIGKKTGGIWGHYWTQDFIATQD